MYQHCLTRMNSSQWKQQHIRCDVRQHRSTLFVTHSWWHFVNIIRRHTNHFRPGIVIRERNHAVARLKQHSLRITVLTELQPYSPRLFVLCLWPIHHAIRSDGERSGPEIDLIFSSAPKTSAVGGMSVDPVLVYQVNKLYWTTPFFSTEKRYWRV